jgi:hypothetical protein
MPSSFEDGKRKRSKVNGMAVASAYSFFLANWGLYAKSLAKQPGWASARCEVKSAKCKSHGALFRR